MKAIMTLSLNYLYLDYVNNFNTVTAFAASHGITDEQATDLIVTIRAIRETAIKEMNLNL